MHHATRKGSARQKPQECLLHVEAERVDVSIPQGIEASCQPCTLKMPHLIRDTESLFVRVELQLSESVGRREDRMSTAAKYDVGMLKLWYLACLNGVIHFWRERVWVSVGVKVLRRRRFAGPNLSGQPETGVCTSAIREDTNTLGRWPISLEIGTIAHQYLSKIRSEGPAHYNRDTEGTIHGVTRDTLAGPIADDALPHSCATCDPHPEVLPLKLVRKSPWQPKDEQAQTLTAK